MLSRQLVEFQSNEENGTQKTTGENQMPILYHKSETERTNAKRKRKKSKINTMTMATANDMLFVLPHCAEQNSEKILIASTLIVGVVYDVTLISRGARAAASHCSLQTEKND